MLLPSFLSHKMLLSSTLLSEINPSITDPLPTLPHVSPIFDTLVCLAPLNNFRYYLLIVPHEPLCSSGFIEERVKEEVGCGSACL